jgi:fructokinase
MLKTLSFGAVIVDVIGRETFLGGDSLNFAANTYKLGAESYLLTRLGNDEYGIKAKKEIEDMGVKGKYIQQDISHATGHSTVTFNSAYVPSYQFAENVSDEYIAVDDSILNDIRKDEFDVFWYSSYCQFSNKSRDALIRILEHSNFKLSFCDINIRRNFYKKEMLIDSFRLADILKMNEDEAKLVCAELYGHKIREEEMAERLKADFDLELICITKGPAGCSLYGKYDGRLDSPAFPFPVLDTVGAGDAFSSAFIIKYYRTKDVIKAAECGNLLGSFVASQKGAIACFPEEIYKQLELDI